MSSPTSTQSPSRASATAGYILILLVVVVLVSLYNFRSRGLFACPASGYGPDTYLAYCGSLGYGDYDYGAFWFGLEPDAIRAAADAQVLFVGNSRTQYALSSEATNEWFAHAKASHFLLGFAYDGNYNFTAPLLSKIQPKARAYVINLDLFFEPEPTPPARVVMRGGAAESHYARKKLWQDVHLLVCARVSGLCGNHAAFFRSRETGAWTAAGGQFEFERVSFDEHVNPTTTEAYVNTGREFLAQLPVRRECQILTVVPTVNTPSATAKAIAAALGRALIAPQLADLQTFDRSHLDQPSAEQWSKAFMVEAGQTLQKCILDQGPGLQTSGAAF